MVAPMACSNSELLASAGRNVTISSPTHTTRFSGDHVEQSRTELAGVEATAFAIADNRTAELAEWEEDKLAQVLQSLKVEDADLLAATGYDDAEVDKMVGAEVTEDEVPEPPADDLFGIVGRNQIVRELSFKLFVFILGLTCMRGTNRNSFLFLQQWLHQAYLHILLEVHPCIPSCD